MGIAKDMWTDAVVDSGEQFISGEIGEAELRIKLYRLGFDPIEIDDYLSELRKDRENV